MRVFAVVDSVLSVAFSGDLDLDLDRLLKRRGGDLDLPLPTSLMRRGDLDRLLKPRGGDLDLDRPLIPKSLTGPDPKRIRSLSRSRLSLLLSLLPLLLLIQGLLPDRSRLLLRLLLWLLRPLSLSVSLTGLRLRLRLRL